MATIKKSFVASSLPVAFSRGEPIAIDSSLVWYSLEELQNYAQNSAVSYPGQIVALVDEVGGAATAYIILNENGDLQEVGKATVGDNKTIVLNDGALALKNWGVQYYRWVEGDDENPGQHVLQVVDDDHPWIAGLEPKVATGTDGVLVLEWYQPSSTTIEGVSSIVSSLQTTVGNLSAAIGDAEDTPEDATVYGAIADVKENYLPLSGGVLTGALTLNDGGEAASKTYVANAVSSAGHLKRSVVAALPTVEEADADTIYMVKDETATGDQYKEYMLIDGALAQIGDTSVDLEPYATKEALATQKEELSGSIDTVNGALADHKADAVAHVTADERNAWNSAVTDLAERAAIKAIGNNLELTENGTLNAVVEEYELPTASATELGGVKVGDNLQIADGVLSVPAASATTAGVLAAADYVKLQNLPENAQENVVVGALLNGVAAQIDEDKNIVVPLASENAGLVVSSDEDDKVAVQNDGTMTVNSLSTSKLYVPSGETLILFGGNAE